MKCASSAKPASSKARRPSATAQKPAAQLEEEELEADLARLESGSEAFGIGSLERLAALHTGVLSDLRWRVLQPHGIRHMGKVFLADETLGGQVAGIEAPLRGRWLALQERVRREGYTRPATAYVEGTVPCGFPPSGYGR